MFKFPIFAHFYREAYELQERSTRDATAVKLLTVITLIYLPVTVVAVSLKLHDDSSYNNDHRTSFQVSLLEWTRILAKFTLPAGPGGLQ